MTSPLTESGSDLEIKYNMQMRAKNMHEELWTYLNPQEEYYSIKFDCDGASELCTYFPVGFLPELDYEMYDVAIEVAPNDQLRKM